MEGKVLIFFLVAFASREVIGQLEEASPKVSCLEFPCTGKYEECEVVADTALCIKRCPDCKVNEAVKPVCGSDGKSYDSLCHLQQVECFQNIIIEPLCKGKCPCDPKELENMDPDTVHKLQKFRLKVHLERRFNQEMQKEIAAEEAFHNFKESKEEKPVVLNLTSAEEIEKVYSKKMKKWMKKKTENISEKKKQQEEATMQQTKVKLEKNVCSKQEFSELPGRLIDWFHVLKSNAAQSPDGQSKKPTIKEMSFLDAKLKAMYVTLACKEDPNRPDAEVFCLQPVQWMFDYLDENKDGVLQHTELADIENVDSEHCMKKFFLGCDRNQNGTVEKTEFCRCLCVEPPCTRAIENIPTIVVSGVPRPLPGLFVPKCNEDGFFVSKQCTAKECFCVNRYGLEVPETRVRGTNLECSENTLIGKAQQEPESDDFDRSPLP